ncbi:MAG: SPW repeat domain-containing protein [Actinomycetota bacterium]
MRFLPTKIHGALDYIVGIALILAPNIFHFSSVGGPAVWIPRVLGVALILYSIFTNYEWGVVRKLPMTYHLVVDFLAAAFLTASPFLFGFTHHGLNAWLPHVVVGAAVIVVVLVSQTQPGNARQPSKQAEPSGARAAWAPAAGGSIAPRSGSYMPGATEADRRAEMNRLRPQH